MNPERSDGRAPAPDQAPPFVWAESDEWIPPPPPELGATGTAPGRRWTGARVSAAIAGALIAGVAIGVPLGLLTRGSHPATGTSPNSASASAAAVQARALYMQALAATRGSAGFHYVSHSTGGTVVQTIVGDAGQSGGRQVITVAAAASTEQFTLVLIGGTVYFEGNVPALEDQLGVPAANAAALQDKWISVSNQDGPYSVVAPGITVADQAEETSLVPTSTTPIGTAGGTGAIRILGAVPPQQGAPRGTGHLDIATSTDLPISYVSAVSVNGVTATSTTTFSGWGTTAVVVAPTGAVAWSTLGASSPPGGYGNGGGGPSPSSTPQV